MTLVRYQPWSLHQEIWNQFNKVAERVASNDAAPAADWSPAVDIEEYADKFALYVDLPGVDLSTVEVTLEKGVLSLAGNREARAEQKEVQRSRSERVSGRFNRRFTLPDTVDGEGVTATGKNGVLEVVIPKRPAVQPRRISVNNA